MRLRWSAEAYADRKSIFEYIDTDSPEAAIKVDERIWKALVSLLEFPEKGRKGRIAGTRELVISRTSCVAAYRIQGEVIRIVRILHGARRWPKTMPQL